MGEGHPSRSWDKLSGGMGNIGMDPVCKMQPEPMATAAGGEYQRQTCYFYDQVYRADVGKCREKKGCSHDLSGKVEWMSLFGRAFCSVQ